MPGPSARVPAAVWNAGGAPRHCGRSGCLDAEVTLERLRYAVGLERGGIEALEQVLSDGAGAAVIREAEHQPELLAVGAMELAFQSLLVSPY